MTTVTTELLSVIELENEFIPPIGETEARDVAWEQRLNAEVAWQLARATVDDGLAQWTDRAEEGAMRRLPTMRTIARMNTVLVALRERLYQIQNEAANIAIAELALRQQSNPAASTEDAFSPLHAQNARRIEALAASCYELLAGSQGSLAAVAGKVPAGYVAAGRSSGLEDSLYAERRQRETVIDFPDRRAAA
ncbi:hypothetical protein GPA22_01635 [Aromatoleum toluvorans]|uniref:Uncharacterized protein n=1 Tax=Aromatoleum toluvorans TaxID=92002 RepID=A0ABX1PUY8_9RHOO|nr:hypothetical protein [Aromatoleum toluvorans]NMG42435.1 hypothetical protein [Aromatoleum toluvorans]